MIWQAQCYPDSVDDLKPVLELVARARRRPRQPATGCAAATASSDCIPLLEGWRRLADQAGVAVNIETHRDRMTTDLLFTLQLLDCFPGSAFDRRSLALSGRPGIRLAGR